MKHPILVISLFFLSQAAYAAEFKGNILQEAAEVCHGTYGTCRNLGFIAPGAIVACCDAINFHMTPAEKLRHCTNLRRRLSHLTNLSLAAQVCISDAVTKHREGRN